jgi:hypothetical protein
MLQKTVEELLYDKRYGKNPIQNITWFIERDETIQMKRIYEACRMYCLQNEVSL